MGPRRIAACCGCFFDDEDPVIRTFLPAIQYFQETAQKFSLHGKHNQIADSQLGMLNRFHIVLSQNLARGFLVAAPFDTLGRGERFHRT